MVLLGLPGLPYLPTVVRWGSWGQGAGPLSLRKLLEGGQIGPRVCWVLFFLLSELPLLWQSPEFELLEALSHLRGSVQSPGAPPHAHMRPYKSLELPVGL